MNCINLSCFCHEADLTMKVEVGQTTKQHIKGKAVRFGLKKNCLPYLSKASGNLTYRLKYLNTNRLFIFGCVRLAVPSHEKHTGLKFTA